ESSAGLAAVVDGSLYGGAFSIQLAFVMYLGAGCLEVENHCIALDASSHGSLAQGAGIGACQLFAILLQYELGRATLASQVNLGIPGACDIGSMGSHSRDKNSCRNQ